MKYLIALAVLFFAYNVTTAIEKETKQGKFLSMFNIVRFPNDPCDGGSRNGTCYTTEECENKGGTEDGSCAQGYGVCCTFVSQCGASVSENNTFFESSGEEKSHCSLQVCKVSGNIVQLRLDFVDFVINAPSTDITTVVAYSKGAALVAKPASPAIEGAVSLAGKCLEDVFSVSNPGGPSPPQICGNNVDQHMYVDMGADCIDLTFQLSGSGTLADPKWNIRITQYESGFDNLAPFGCTQYYYKRDSDSDGKGTITSYNYNSGGSMHLADQNQVICIRREDDQTRICYWTLLATDLAISGHGAKQITAAASTVACGGYKDGTNGIVRDALIIPSLEPKTVADPALTTLKYGNVCGQGGFSYMQKDPAMPTMAKLFPGTVCSKSHPFVVTFNSDAWELHGSGTATENEDDGGTAPNIGGNTGFKIQYEQDTK